MAPTLRRSITPLGEFEIPDFGERFIVSANTMGNPDAPVIIEEFSDFGCGHCGDFSNTTSLKIAEEYAATGKVYFIYRSVGGLIGSRTSPVASEAAYCAGDQDKFWEYHEIIFANQYLLFANPSADVEGYLNSFAEALDLDMTEFSDCFDGRKYKTQVQEDEADARAAGVEGTPSFLVNGTLLRGNIPYDTFQQEIENALAAAGN